MQNDEIRGVEIVIYFSITYKYYNKIKSNIYTVYIYI